MCCCNSWHGIAGIIICNPAEMRSTSDMLRLQRVQGIESRAGGLAPMEVIEEIVLVQCMSQVLAHTDET